MGRIINFELRTFTMAIMYKLYACNMRRTRSRTLDFCMRECVVCFVYAAYGAEILDGQQFSCLLNRDSYRDGINSFDAYSAFICTIKCIEHGILSY